MRWRSKRASSAARISQQPKNSQVRRSPIEPNADKGAKGKGKGNKGKENKAKAKAKKVLVKGKDGKGKGKSTR